MSGLDILSGVAFGLFLLVAVMRGKENTDKLITLAKRDRAFVLWGLSLAILMWLYRHPALRGPVALIIVAALIGLGLHAGGNITQGAKDFWKLLGGEK